MLFYINDFYGTDLSILGCVSAFGLIALSQQVPTSGRKKQKTEELGFVLNNLELKNMHIVMDSSPIHRTKEVLKAIMDNSHHAMSLPPYSPYVEPYRRI
ncbi:hypothetical protein [Parasitella parasitica]|uniref:Tc1-like transposase DDE domain-containing protein n=1 Tax=Parasitella parasitica TaxID=35722 RepID=A0A0B7ND53_9FUNG|nr:hypothetical protein [Parasitella parasitica]